MAAQTLAAEGTVAIVIDVGKVARYLEEAIKERGRRSSLHFAYPHINH
ncbi:MAG: hypothetical protein HYX73_04100 [Acidobacteria bacterium]|nr:hypothetical protein [Acidobacteriota bacterium]